MLHLDALELYELPEAARLLLCDPARLTREARSRKIPAALVGDQLGLPAPWVRAAAGIDPVDEEGLRGYWLARLAPPPRTSHRPGRARERLPAETLLTPIEVSRRLLVDDLRLARWDGDGTLPALLVDGEARYDALLVDLVARGVGAEERRATVREWSRYSWRVSDSGAKPPESETLVSDPPPEAYSIPEDLQAEAPPASKRLIRTEGYETVDED